jgi:hypothetical protein
LCIFTDITGQCLARYEKYQGEEMKMENIILRLRD